MIFLQYKFGIMSKSNYSIWNEKQLSTCDSRLKSIHVILKFVEKQ